MSNNILSVVRNKNVSTSDLMKVVAGNVRAMRLRRNISQKDFASKVGIALPTYRRFETTGEISLRKLVEIAKFFDVAGDFKNLFTKREYSSIEEVIKEKPNRERASKNG
ncbi:MAG: helix-turn-helix transcriptional regulator [Opitutales bacterium]|nr:helix-turn-helix transcriptional regulator [Opitutales bacterium]